MLYAKTLAGLALLLLSLSLTSCANVSSASDPVACPHPLVDPRTAEGMAQGLVDYADALDMCNTLNGFGPT